MADSYNLEGLSPAPLTPTPATDVQPQDASTSADAIPVTQDGFDLSGLTIQNPEAAAQSALEARYGTFPQQLLTVGEGAAQGVLGPLAPWLEQKTGLTTGADIRGRQETNPVLHAGSEAASFAASAVFGDEIGLSGIVGKVGDAAANLSRGVGDIAEAAEVGEEASEVASGASRFFIDPSKPLDMSFPSGSIAGNASEAIGKAYNTVKEGAQSFAAGFREGYTGVSDAVRAAAKEAGVEIQKTPLTKAWAKLVIPEVGAAQLIPEVAGVRTAAELATIQASNELSKMVEGDPDQTLGSAAINIGLSGVMGGLGGALFDKVNPIAYFAKSRIKNAASLVISSLVGDGVALAGGAALGYAVGFPVVGAVLAEKTLGPCIAAFAKPYVEKLIDMKAAESAVSYIYAANEGQRTLTKTIAALFESGASSLQLKDLVMPDKGSRERLERAIEKSSDPQNALTIGQNIAHYLPQHTTGAAQMSATAINYFKTLKPTQTISQPLDSMPPVDKAAQYNYERQLDIAQQPLAVLKHVQNGALLPQDVQTMKTVFPGLHNSMIQKMTDQIIQNKATVPKLPYAQRVSMNLLMGGNALDSTMSASSMQAIMNSASPKSQMQAQETKSGSKHGASNATLNQLNKVNQLYSTPLQARQIQKRS